MCLRTLLRHARDVTWVQLSVYHVPCQFPVFLHALSFLHQIHTACIWSTQCFSMCSYIYIIYIILLYLYNLIIYIYYIYSAHPCKDILKINNMYNIFTIHTYDKRCISLRSLYIKNVSHNWLISIGSMVIQGSLNIYDVSQIWYTPMWWYVSFFSSVSLDLVGKEEEVKEGKR